MIRVLAGVAFLTLVLDQASKFVILDFVMMPPRVIEVMPIFNLVLVFNKGVSFGIFGGAGDWQPFALSGLALVICAGLVFWQWRQRTMYGAVAVGLIVGGALGNVIDRLRFGAVVDFLDFHLGGWHWPAFNLSDSAITLGVLVILAVEVLPKRSIRDKTSDGGRIK